ncbi:Methyltransferase-like protein 21D [Modicella reniformis]|uniref:Methyltransferase-like protein 21D n=1 Tax=Modicella reniformis TaxID=1440133 RepID=A0A9P6MAG1_9FUNG|nr:Methyltransferase-like protein 21D [Modicella reniformis]
MDHITLASRDYEFNDHSIKALEIDEDPSGLLRGGVGSTIWDAGIVLAKFLERSNVLALAVATAAADSNTTVNVLELGAGTGIVGLAVARMLSAKNRMARIVLTDKDNVVLLLQRNVEKNRSNGVDIEARVLDWEAVSGIKVAASLPAADGARTQLESVSSSSIDPAVTDNHELLDTEWDLVILSDCIWVPALYPPLIGTINTIIKSDRTELVIAFEKRSFAEEMEFFAMLGKTFRFSDIKPKDQDADYQSEDIYLFKCQRRTQ